MHDKIFISYRRQDTAANALGISQYLEHEFGRKNVFIDVDMCAGAKFPIVLEQRLAECKVMLVLIGPNWLNSQDEKGNRRLEISDDWVRLEIAHALKRNITVIPVRVNGAELPERAALPDDIKGLLDHQAASVTNAGFRHEMSGLAHDLRAIATPRPWRRFGLIAAGVLLLLTALGLAQTYGLSTGLERARHFLFPQTPISAQNEFWNSTPGEWVLFAIDQKPVAYYFKPSSVRSFADRVVYTARFPLKSYNTTAPPDSTAPHGTFEDDSTAIDCKKNLTTLAERTIYNNSGEIVSHFKRGDPESPDFAISDPIKPGTILSIGAHLICDEQLRTSLSQQMANTKLSYLTTTSSGDGEIFYGPTTKSSDLAYQIELLFIIKFHEDHGFAEVFPGQTVIGLPPSYRTFAEPLQLNCTDRKVQTQKFEYFDRENNSAYLVAPFVVQPMDVQEESPFGLLLKVICGPAIPNVGGKYEGVIDMTYKTGGQGEQKITITVEQLKSDVKMSFQTALGGQGNGAGTLTGSSVESISLQSTTPGCPGSYEGSLKFIGDTMSWSYKGQDCGGPMDGHGTAKRTKE